jgi:hypothetical protein
MGFYEVLLIALGIALGILGLTVVRWLLLSPPGRRETDNLVDELNRFSQQMRQFAGRLSDLSRVMEGRGGNLRARNIELMENLTEMNRLLRQLNQFFSESRVEESAEDEFQASDFTSEDEEEKFDRLGEIRDEDIRNVNWDELLDRLRRETEKEG